jgi:hypothetical protein
VNTIGVPRFRALGYFDGDGAAVYQVRTAIHGGGGAAAQPLMDKEAARRSVGERQYGGIESGVEKRRAGGRGPFRERHRGRRGHRLSSDRMPDVCTIPSS